MYLLLNVEVMKDKELDWSRKTDVKKYLNKFLIMLFVNIHWIHGLWNIFLVIAHKDEV